MNVIKDDVRKPMKDRKWILHIDVSGMSRGEGDVYAENFITQLNKLGIEKENVAVFPNKNGFTQLEEFV